MTAPKIEIRLATPNDIQEVSAIYEAIHADFTNLTGWKAGIYPTAATAQLGVKSHDLFVLTVNGKIQAAARLNQEQDEFYNNCSWQQTANAPAAMVIHTLVVSPAARGQGLAARFISFYEEFSRKEGCLALRLDTNEGNLPARRLYARLGYSEVAALPCTFHGITTRLVCLEKSL